MKENAIFEIECLGDVCPVPVMKFKKHEKKLLEGMEIKLITDHSCVSENIINYCKSLNYSLRIVEPINGVWELYIKYKP